MGVDACVKDGFRDVGTFLVYRKQHVRENLLQREASVMGGGREREDK